MKKIVVLQMKNGGKKESFATCSELVRAHSKEQIGIGLNALWNALSKGGGKFENRYCKIWYKKVDLEPKQWE